MALGQRVRQARIAAGMTQQELADRVGVSQTAILNLEQRDSASSRNSGGLARALNVRLQWLVSGEEPMHESSLVDETTDPSQDKEYEPLYLREAAQKSYVAKASPKVITESILSSPKGRRLAALIASFVERGISEEDALTMLTNIAQQVLKTLPLESAFDNHKKADAPAHQSIRKMIEDADSSTG